MAAEEVFQVAADPVCAEDSKRVAFLHKNAGNGESALGFVSSASYPLLASATRCRRIALRRGKLRSPQVHPRAG